MQRIINALIQYRNAIIYLILLIISLLYLNRNSNFHKNKLEKYGLYFSQSIYNLSYSISKYFDLKKINSDLFEENRKLKEFELKSKSVSLYPRNYFKEKRYPFVLKKGNVIKNSFLNQRNFIIVDKGKSNGINPEMGVISEKGIIGIVKSVSENYSSVISILNQDLKINIRLKNSNAIGTLSWKGINPKEFQIEDIVRNTDIQIGDTIITGGMSSYFPFGIPIGKITDFEDNSKVGYYSINAKLFEDPSLIYHVYIIENKDLDEINRLQENTLK